MISGIVGHYSVWNAATASRLLDYSPYKRNATFTAGFTTASLTSAAVNGRSGRVITSASGLQADVQYDFGQLDAVGFAAWLRPTSTTGTQGLCSSGTGIANPRLLCVLESAGTGLAKMGCYRGTYAYSTDTIAINTWSHICCYHDGSTCFFWINGRFSNSAANTISKNSQSVFYLFTTFWPAFVGQLAEAMVFTQKPTDADVYANFIGGPAATLQAPRRRFYSVGQATGSRRRRILCGDYS